MYTGIVQACLPVKSLVKKEGLYSFSIDFPASLREGLETGASVAVNGVCFTVTRMASAEIFFDADFIFGKLGVSATKNILCPTLCSLPTKSYTPFLTHRASRAQYNGNAYYYYYY